jgi:hypothetical protein
MSQQPGSWILDPHSKTTATSADITLKDDRPFLSKLLGTISNRPLHPARIQNLNTHRILHRLNQLFNLLLKLHKLHRRQKTLKNKGKFSFIYRLLTVEY